MRDDYVRLNQLLDVAQDVPQPDAFRLYDEACRIRLRLADDPAMPTWLVGMADFVVSELRP